MDYAESGKLTIPIEELVSSYIHMAVNRLMPSQQRLYEMVQYDFLYKYYRSKLAQGKDKSHIFQSSDTGQ